MQIMCKDYLPYTSKSGWNLSIGFKVKDENVDADNRHRVMTTTHMALLPGSAKM